MLEEIKAQVKASILAEGYTQEEADSVQVFQLPGEDFYRFHFGRSTKEFIRIVLIEEINSVIEVSPWLSFILIGSGIEFLGKCIDTEYPEDWDKSGRSSINFKDAIRNLQAFNRYKYLLDKPDFNFYGEFRCGLAHGFVPKSGISLSSKPGELANLIEINGVVNFHIRDLYSDFKNACEEVINMTFTEPNKMNKVRMYINGTYSIPTQTAFTSSFEIS